VLIKQLNSSDSTAAPLTNMSNKNDKHLRALVFTTGRTCRLHTHTAKNTSTIGVGRWNSRFLLAAQARLDLMSSLEAESQWDSQMSANVENKTLLS